MNTGRAPASAHTFRDRSEAGRLLAQQLRAYAGRPDAVVLALPRGGVPVGYEIARELHLAANTAVGRASAASRSRHHW